MKHREKRKNGGEGQGEGTTDLRDNIKLSNMCVIKI